MEILEAIKSRRSIRKYEDEPVSREAIEKIVETARFAPSWKNSQTTRFIVINDADLKDKVASECVNEWNKKLIDRAPTLVVQTTKNERSGYERDGSFSNSKGTHWQSYDAGLAGEAFCLAAYEEGYGTLIMGMFDEAKVIETVGVPEGQSVSALIAIGKAAESPDAPPRKDVTELVTFK